MPPQLSLTEHLRLTSNTLRLVTFLFDPIYCWPRYEHRVEMEVMQEKLTHSVKMAGVITCM